MWIKPKTAALFLVSSSPVAVCIVTESEASSFLASLTRTLPKPYLTRPIVFILTSHSTVSCCSYNMLSNLAYISINVFIVRLSALFMATTLLRPCNANVNRWRSSMQVWLFRVGLVDRGSDNQSYLHSHRPSPITDLRYGTVSR